MDAIVDTSFGLNSQVLAVAYYMSKMEPNFAEYKDGVYKIRLETKPWYNGRETGFVVSMCAKFFGNKFLHIACFEHRNSDNICLLKWETETAYWNHPLENPELFDLAYGGKDKTKYDVAASFGYGEVGDVANWIYNEMKEFYEETKEKEEE